jgi:hypothetical protein
MPPSPTRRGSSRPLVRIPFSSSLTFLNGLWFVHPKIFS